MDFKYWASNHITFNLKWLYDTNDPNYFVNPTTIKLPDGSTAKVKGAGKYNLDKVQIIHNVLYMPEFKFNLLSVSQLSCDLPWKVSFFSNFCVI